MRAGDNANEALLLAHVEDLFSRAASGVLAMTAFLTPHEQKLLSRHFAGKEAHFVFFGGYAEAERTRMILLPPYIADADEPWRACLIDEARGEAVVSLEVRGSGYRTLTHRDFLGAVLHLGLKREVIGDICVLDANHAVLFCDPRMAEFLKENLTRVANDAVRIGESTLPPDFDGGRRFERLTDTVASPRLDAVVAALCRLSRERAQGLITAEQVELDFEITAKCDREVVAGAVVTVHGFGKYKIRSLGELTKKGRLRLAADRYV